MNIHTLGVEMKLTPEQQTVSNHAAAILVQTQRLYSGGELFETAKRRAIDGYKMETVPKHLRADVRTLADAIGLEDMESRDHREFAMTVYDRHIRPVARFPVVSRFLWRWFGAYI